jgi:hypothetical protein
VLERQQAAAVVERMKAAGSTKPWEAPMRISALAIVIMTAIWTAAPAQAQTYDPAYPVCLHIFKRGGDYYQCSYTSLEQCKQAASTRATMCDINPYYAGAQRSSAPQRQRRAY